MPASTPFLGLYKPGGGSTGLITPDEVVDIDRLNTNADLIDAFAKSYGPATERNHQFYGPAASLSGVTGMKLGDTYQESDGNKVLWEYDGANWVTNESGMYLIRPSSVVGATVDADGTIRPTATAVSVNGAFTTRFRKYRVEYVLRFGTATGMNYRLRAAGTDATATQYTSQTLESSGSTTTSALLANQSSFYMANGTMQSHWGHFELSNLSENSIKLSEGVHNGASAHAIRSGYLSGADSTVFDGFTIYGFAAAPLLPVSWIKIYGLA